MVNICRQKDIFVKNIQLNLIFIQYLSNNWPQLGWNDNVIQFYRAVQAVQNSHFSRSLPNFFAENLIFLSFPVTRFLDLCLWWSCVDPMMILWWSYDNPMMILWWSNDDPMMITWFRTAVELELSPDWIGWDWMVMLYHYDTKHC